MKSVFQPTGHLEEISTLLETQKQLHPEALWVCGKKNQPGTNYIAVAKAQRDKADKLCH